MCGEDYFVSQVYIIRIKIHEQNKNTVGAKTRSLWEWVFAPFSATQEVCSKLENQAKCDSAVFCNKSAENSFFAHVLIPRIGYYS